MRMNRCRVEHDLREYEARQEALMKATDGITERDEQLDRVIKLADMLLAGGTFIDFRQGMGTASYDIGVVMSELMNHPLYDNALEGFCLGHEDALRDLKIRVARRTAAFILRFDPEELGLGE